MRLSRCEVRDHTSNTAKTIARARIDSTEPLQRLKSPMRYICEIFGVVRFSTFTTMASTTRPYYVMSASKASASFTSRVSRPSVNQP
jgi:hypothetical protein